MQKLLVIRNDKLGDFMLIFPALALIKKANPQLKITALVPKYTAPMAELCPYIDDIIIDAQDKKDKAQFKQVLQTIKAANFDAVISFFSNWHNAKLVWLSGIKYRLAPATKLAQLAYNHRLTQRRSRSLKPEFEYNLDLARVFLQDQHLPLDESPPPYLVISQEILHTQKSKLQQHLGITQNKKWIFLHSGTGGSANNLSLVQYAELIKETLQQFDAYIILTAGPNESEKAHQLAQLVNSPNVVMYDKNEGLLDFTYSLACADLFIAGSTGPLHICGALNVPTIGFFPSHRSATPLRWQPINDPNRHLAFSPPNEEKVLSNIKIKEIFPQIRDFIHHLWY
ncbi:glycosyltransferase family 9 protein [Avibacterium sp. 20-129]|uniref:glycosyltransferase family 9 protein n=1 Tax=Avibacterium sp. 20-129 TaxID=2911525 RepID=UPI002245EA73|nr:glycosyltransferase family 9 protein [Avibacterium sp. 20-129]MCW9698884.1 glycosyltransferase family 9 protein [Avibacterium sp. 20-129]